MLFIFKFLEIIMYVIDIFLCIYIYIYIIKNILFHTQNLIHEIIHKNHQL